MGKKITNRFDFIYVFDVKDGNPNGDPDAGNLPRIDPETAMGLVTDVCLKRKIRNYVSLVKMNQSSYDIFIKEKAILNDSIEDAYNDESVNSKQDKDKIAAARDYMCQHYFDVRTFGAVMSTGKNAGQVRGPVQLTFARSIEPIFSQEHSITRMAVATPEEAKKQKGDNRTMGKKYTVPYGVYCSHGFVSAALAEQTGFSEEDLDLLWQSLINMFDQDHSAARGEMNARALIVFKHDSELGNAPSNELFDCVKITPAHDENTPARSWADYKIDVAESAIPSGVTLIRML